MVTHFAIVVVVTLVASLPALGQGSETLDSESRKSREFWNGKFRSGLPNVRKEPNRLLVEAVAGYEKIGAALDLGCGDGRNLLYLAGKGWSVTGVDISDVAVEQAKAAANIKADFLVRDLDAFEPGQNRWDLLSSIYMQDWHLKSRTDTFAKMRNAVKPGGIVVIEGFGPPNGFSLDSIKRAFERFAVLRAEVVLDDPDWGKG